MKAENGIDPVDLGKCRSLLPKESDFVGKPGYQRNYREDGSYTWKCSFTPNDGHGKLTREAQEVGEMIKPFSVADTERQARIQARIPSEALKDDRGGINYVRSEFAEMAAKRNGWKPVVRYSGRRVMEGMTPGMLWADDGRGSYEPLGVRCLTRPYFGPQQADRKLVHLSPTGVPWKWLDGAWVRLEDYQ